MTCRLVLCILRTSTLHDRTRERGKGGYGTENSFIFIPLHKWLSRAEILSGELNANMASVPLCAPTCCACHLCARIRSLIAEADDNGQICFEIHSEEGSKMRTFVNVVQIAKKLQF